MFIYLLEVNVLLHALLLQRVCGQECDDGWFGENCMFACRCREFTFCEMTTGECPKNGPCELGYFGTGCQFVDLVYWQTENYVPHFLRDNNDDTCNTDPNALSVELSQNEKYPFSWYRIVVNNETHLLNFTTTLNDGQPCINERKFQVSDTIVDVTCDVIVSLEKLQIDGQVAGSICSVYISGGRNAALLQETSQISTYKNGTSSKAVDDNTDGVYLHDHCSHTHIRNPHPWWLLTFNRPHILYYVRIYNRNGYSYRLKGFKLQTFNENGTVVTENVDKTNISRSVYVFNVHSTTPVTAVKITQGSGFPSRDYALTLCEVETYGDNICSNNTYGLYCQYSCNCSSSEICHVVTGACAPICHAGYYGFNCTLNCTSNCLHAICEWMTGYCLHCNPGYMGVMCNKECSPGYYGIDCKNACSDRCMTCDPVNGNCTCKSEFTGPNCADCAKTFYGQQCNRSCPENCLNRMCHPLSGFCTSCERGFGGIKCQYDNRPSLALIIIAVISVLSLFYLLLVRSKGFLTREKLAEEQDHT